MTPELVVRSRRVVTPDGVTAAAVHIAEGRVSAVTAFDALPAGVPLRDAGDLAVMPGVVDTHVHVNEPGRTEWEGFETATRAAAAGGVTTIVDMPLNSIPATTTVAALDAKRSAAQGRIAVDVAFWGGVIPGSAPHQPGLCDAGVRGFKCFLVPSGVDEFPASGEVELRAALPILAARNVPLLVHAELSGPIERAVTRLAGEDVRCHDSWMQSRPPGAELAAIELLIRLAREFRARIHIVHVSAAESIPLIRAARGEGLRITAETCPHYLTFASEDVPLGATEFKCAPPIRRAANREALWTALLDGELDLVASDHSPCPPEMKCRDTGDFTHAWGGVASLETSLAAVWTGLSARTTEQHGSTRPNKGRLEQLARIMCAAPAQLAGLSDRKGTLSVGADADFVIWDPDAQFTVVPERLQQRHKLTPYAGMSLRGVVDSTYLRGRAVYERGVVHDGGGRLL